MKKYVMIGFLIMGVLYVRAQESIPDNDVEEYYQQSDVQASEVEAWKAESSFAYMTYLDSLLRDMQKPVPLQDLSDRRPRSNWLSKLLNSNLMEWIGWIIAFSIVGFILYRFFNTEGVFFKPRKLNAVEVPENEAHEEVRPDADFDALITQAFNHHNYRLAIKYAYVQTLYQLQEKGHILLQSGKTNQDYLRSLPKEFRPSFTPLLHVYEYVWYGEKMPDTRAAENILHHFNQFREKL